MPREVSGPTEKRVAYTPGPWLIDPANTKQIGVYVPSYPNVVANVARRHNGVGEANARLIAAAPELLDVSKRILGHTKVGYQSIVLPILLVQDLEQAVARAEKGE